MRRYRVTVHVTHATGLQSWLVDADSPEDAMIRFEDGEAALESEALEAVTLKPLTLDDVEECND